MAESPPLERYCWFDGGIAALDDIRIHPLAFNFLYGTGAFEGVRAYRTERGPAVFRLREHLERLQRSASTYGIAVPYDTATLVEAVLETMRVNDLDSAYIRPIAYFDVSPRIINLGASLHNTPVHVCVMAWKLPEFLSGTAEFRVTVSPIQKASSRAMPSVAKTCGHYTNATLAFTDAARRGFQEAIMLNVKGDVAEATSENVFVVKGGRITTNDVTADILLGVTRDSVIALAADLDIPLEIRPLTTADLHGADEMFLTGTAAEIKSVDAIDETRFGSHPITDRLREAYRRAYLGEDPKHADWLTFVLGSHQPA